jgi:hypothetical protein
MKFVHILEAEVLAYNWETNELHEAESLRS